MPQETVTTQQEYYCRLTDAGAALEAATHAEGRPVLLTHVAVGDGNGEVPLPEASSTALVHEVLRREIDGKRQDGEDKNITWLHVIIPADEGGFWIREFGIYAAPLTEGADPVLYAVGNHAPYYKQQAAQGQATTHELSIPVIHSGTAEVEISVKDAGYASQLALDDLRQSLLENDGEGPHLKGTVLPEDVLTESRVGRGLAMEAEGEGAPAQLAADLATQEAPGIVQPDGVTTTVDEDGLLSALGGNLLLNSEQWITASGTFTAPVTGWYEVLLINGGQGGNISTSYKNAGGGRSGDFDLILAWLEAGQEVPVTIGAGTAGQVTSGSSMVPMGGVTSFGQHSPRFANHFSSNSTVFTSAAVENPGAGPGGLTGHENPSNGQFYGAGGGAYYGSSSSYRAGAGHQGAARLRWHDPAKAAGPLPAPALFSARRAAPRAADAPATVNLYDPETGQGSVWREEDAEAKLAAGLVSEEAWTEICAARAAEAHAAWLADPETEAERFTLLRQARDARLAATDYLMAPDYPLTDEARAAVTAYRQALRDLPAQDGAPWDGGGEATPWPERQG